MEEQQKLDNEEQPKTEVHDEIQLQTNKDSKWTRKPLMWLNDCVRLKKFILLEIRKNIICKFYLILFEVIIFSCYTKLFFFNLI